MTHDTSSGDRLAISPALEAGDAEFLAGFARRAVRARGDVPPGADRVVRIWPGQPAVASPWVPCARGCCLLLRSHRLGSEAVGQWLRFLIAEFLADDHRVDGWVEVPATIGRGSSVLIVEAGDVFEGELDDDTGSGWTR